MSIATNRLNNNFQTKHAMKLNRFLAFAAMAATALSFASCSSDDDDNNDDPQPEDTKLEAVVVSPSTASIKVGESVTITATLVPSTATGDVEWSTSNASVATVEGGVVTGVSAGDAYVTAAVGSLAAMCKVTVKAEGSSDNDYFDQPKGSNFYVFQLDGQTYSSIQSNVVMDLRVDETASKYLYIWDGTYNAGNTIGKNPFGVAEGWVSLTVASVGWSGMGLCYGDADKQYDLSSLYDVYANPSDYVFHIAMKSEDDAAHCLILYGQGTETKFGLGGSFTDNGVTYESLGDISRDGKWNEIEVPMTKFVEAGLVWPETWQPTEGQNIIAFLSGGKTGTQLQYDAMYIYKPAK